ncbi:hypothetical protein [Myxococcus qinghaiensis]|uniref:hypothetical protein n=1 Tax=Myxococcus qinghaiensis TaxID=2906758 RepID=UPI0020A7FE20|nr:hypothetical protein [Myxococcus qinghaiensis]
MIMPPAVPQIASPTAPAAPALFTAATGARDSLNDAFYADERNTTQPKENHPVKSFYNVFTGFMASPPSYANAVPDTFSMNLPNPLNSDPEAALIAAATVLPQKYEKLRIKTPSARMHFSEKRTYFVFVPKKLKDAFDAQPTGSKPKARVSLFFGVGPELNLFGLRRFFAESDDGVLITIPGVESAWEGYGQAWGIGITQAIIKDLLNGAALPGIDFTIEVMAGYSTGYRGVNLTLINKLVPLGNLKRVIYYDAFYNHDDYPLPAGPHPFQNKLTRWAVKEALTASGAEIHIYAYTHSIDASGKHGGGVPRVKGGSVPVGPLDSLLQAHGAKIRFFDFEFKHQGKPLIADSLEKICLARLIQGAIDDYVQESAIGADILALIRLLPERGSFGISGRTGFTDLYAWVKDAPQSNALLGFPITRAIGLITKHILLSPGWTAADHYEFRHRTFVQEIGKEGLLP